MSDEAARDVARAIDALRRGWPVRIAAAEGALAMLAVESADEPRLAAFDPGTRADLLISGARAATLNLANQRDAAEPGPIRIARAPWIGLAEALALADPSQDLARPLQGPFRALPLVERPAAAAALKLARLAGLLPAFFLGEPGAAVAQLADAAAIEGYDDPSRFAIATRARLPITASETAEIVAFRSADEAVEHVALVIGQPDGNPPLVRIHSECLTGDAFGSLKCDCGPQLRVALDRMAARGWGMLLYLRQEGRGIGLVNKLRAYRLQDQGFDTVDANLRLGFAIDARDYGIAARMLRLLGQERIALLTNNPAKALGLAAAGITVTERIGHRAGANAHNLDYLAAKRDRTGHLL